MAETVYGTTEDEDEVRRRLLEAAASEAGYGQEDRSLFDKVTGAVGSAYEVLPEPVQDVAEATGQGAKVVGSKFMEWIGPLAKPWGAFAGTWDVAGEFPGYRLYYDEDLGRLNVKHFEDASPDDTRSYIDRLQQGRREGWAEPHSKNLGDEFSSLLSPDFRDTTKGKIIGGAIEIVVNVAGDPLNLLGAAATIPYKVGKTVLTGAARSRAGKSVLEAAPVRTVLEALNVYTGDAAVAKKIIDTLKRQDRGAKILADKEKFFLNKQLDDIAKKAGVTVDELKTAILTEVEAGTIHAGRLAAISPDAVTFAENERKFMEQILKSEKILGTEDILTAERSRQMRIGGYYPHVLAKGATVGEKVSNWYREVLPPHLYRDIKGTIAEINSAAGRTVFIDDPVVLRTLRQKWSRQALAAHRLADDAKSGLGTKLGAAPEGYVQSPGSKLKLFDEAGNPLPDDFVTIPGMEGYAFPKEGARVLDNFFGNLKNPTQLPIQFKALVKSFDAVQNWWKKYTLGLRPAWHSRNAFSNFWNNWFIGGLKDPRRYGEAAAIQKAMQYNKGAIVGRIDEAASKLTGKVVDPKAKVRGTNMTREEIWDAAVNNGIYEAGFYGADIPTTGISSAIPGSTEWAAINKAFAAGKAVENNARLALFVERIAKGDSIEDAASMVRKALFDYADLSAFEREGMKRAMPFYTWTRKNLPAQLHAILEHPDRANKINLIVGGMQRDAPKINDDDVERWAKDQFPIILSADESEGVYTFITAVSTLPTAELNKIFTDPKSALNFALQMGTPLLKNPLELLMNKTYFRDKNIDKYETLGKQFNYDWGEGVVKSLPYKTGTESFLGIKVTPKQKHLLQSIVLLGELDRANPFSIFGDRGGKKSWAGVPRDQRDLSTAARIIRAAIGGRLYQRDLGGAEARALKNLADEFTRLEELLQRGSVAGDPDQRAHVQYLMRQVIDEINSARPDKGRRDKYRPL